MEEEEEEKKGRKLEEFACHFHTKAEAQRLPPSCVQHSPGYNQKPTCIMMAHTHINGRDHHQLTLLHKEPPETTTKKRDGWGERTTFINEPKKRRRGSHLARVYLHPNNNDVDLFWRKPSNTHNTPESHPKKKKREAAAWEPFPPTFRALLIRPVRNPSRPAATNHYVIPPSLFNARSSCVVR